MIRKLTWDSDFFGINVGQLDYIHLKKRLDLSEFDVLFIKSAEDFIHEIPGFKNSFSETKVVFRKEISQNMRRSHNIFSVEDVDYNITNLYNLAFESGKNSRFLLDHNFTENKFQQLYRTWIDNSIFHDFATDVLLYKVGQEVLGLLTYKTTGNSAAVGLFAVAASMQGKGIGGEMLNFLENLLSDKGIEEVTIPTQKSNQPACNFYSKSGYEISEQLTIKHYWKTK